MCESVDGQQLWDCLTPRQVWLGSVSHLANYRRGQGQPNMSKDKISVYHPSPSDHISTLLWSSQASGTSVEIPDLQYCAQHRTNPLPHASQNVVGQYSVTGGLALDFWSLIVESKCVLCKKQFQLPETGHGGGGGSNHWGGPLTGLSRTPEHILRGWLFASSREKMDLFFPFCQNSFPLSILALNPPSTGPWGSHPS